MASVSKYNQTTCNINVKSATEIAAALVAGGSLYDEMRAAVAQYGDAILGELEIMAALRESDSKAYAQRCLIFAICSPQCRFDTNVRAAARFAERLYDNFETVGDVYDALTLSGTDTWFTAGMVSRNLFASLDFLRNVDESTMSKDTILALRKADVVKGFAQKTASMAVALFDASAEVYTLDVHMLRGALRAAGLDDCQAGTMTITNPAYPVIEAAFLLVHEQVCPQLPVFVSQWALWDRWGFDRHMEHVGIFGAEVA